MKRPLVYYFVSVYIGCFLLLILMKGYVLSGSILAAILLGIVFFNEDKKEFLVITTFFIIGCFSFYLYFSINIGHELEGRVIENKKGYYIVNYKGRKVELYGKLNNLKDGERIVAKGNFKSEEDYFKGIVGKYNIIEYRKKGSDFVQGLYNFRDKLYIKYSKALDEKKASIIMACCYGDTKYLSFDQKKEFNELGISHIISVSGFHIAVVYKFLEVFLGVKLSLIVAFIYMIFTGAKAATIRAFIMILVLKFSKITYRNYDSLSALSLAGLMLIILKPYYILDIGFNLSFLATLGIILYNKKFQRYMYRIPQSINEPLSMTLSAQVFSMPYVMCTIKNVSMFFIPANLILIPIYSIVILLGNIGILLFKINSLFKLNISALYSVLTSIDGATYILLKLSPPTTEYNFLYGVFMLALFMNFIFVKRGYKNLRYFPVIMTCFIIMFNVI